MAEGLLEGLRGEVIDKRVEAAVEGGDAECDGVKGPDEPLQSAAGHCLGAHHGVEKEDWVVGNEADHEDSYVHHNHPEHTLLVGSNLAEGGRLAKRPEYHWRTSQVEEQRDEEANQLNEDRDLGQVCPPGWLGEALKAGGASVGHIGGGEERNRDPTSQDKQPDPGTHNPGIAPGSYGTRTERVDDGQEAVHTDAGKEEHAAVDIGEKGRPWYLAKLISKGPVAVQVVEDLEGQSEDEKQVWDSQVGHKKGGLIAELHAEAEDKKGGTVGDQSEGKDHAVDSRVQVVLKGIINQATAIAAIVCARHPRSLVRVWLLETNLQ